MIFDIKFHTMITQICPPHLKNVTALTCEKN